MSLGKTTGNNGEDIAVLYFEQLGFTILERNYKVKNHNEIDIIAINDEHLVAVEVKTSETRSEVEPFERVSDQQINRIKFALQQYADLKNQHNKPMRVDVLSIILDTKEIEHFSSVDAAY